jgi:hypothetical protein
MRCQNIGQVDSVLRGEILTAALLADSDVGGGVSGSPRLLRVRVGVGSSSSNSTCSWTAALVVGAFCFCGMAQPLRLIVQASVFLEQCRRRKSHALPSGSADDVVQVL